MHNFHCGMVFFNTCASSVYHSVFSILCVCNQRILSRPSLILRLVNWVNKEKQKFMSRKWYSDSHFISKCVAGLMPSHYCTKSVHTILTFLTHLVQSRIHSHKISYIFQLCTISRMDLHSIAENDYCFIYRPVQWIQIEWKASGTWNRSVITLGHVTFNKPQPYSTHHSTFLWLWNITLCSVHSQMHGFLKTNV
jgi:hypothetical protein